jgi:hypothetical protein
MIGRRSNVIGRCRLEQKMGAVRSALTVSDPLPLPDGRERVRCSHLRSRHESESAFKRLHLLNKGTELRENLFRISDREHTAAPVALRGQGLPAQEVL